MYIYLKLRDSIDFICLGIDKSTFFLLLQRCIKRNEAATHDKR